jgi:superfamily II DNA helicase RecQ
MKLTVINLFYSADGGFDAGALEEFCRTHEVRGWVHHFFVDGGCPQLALVLEYEEILEARTSGRSLRSERDFRRELPAPARLAYDRLRDWRSLRARQDGVPVYVVFSNRELAAIAAAMPATKEAMRGIEGVGKGKADKYAEDVFTLLASLSETAPKRGEEPGDGDS